MTKPWRLAQEGPKAQICKRHGNCGKHGRAWIDNIVWIAPQLPFKTPKALHHIQKHLLSDTGLDAFQRKCGAVLAALATSQGGTDLTQRRRTPLVVRWQLLLPGHLSKRHSSTTSVLHHGQGGTSAQQPPNEFWKAHNHAHQHPRNHRRVPHQQCLHKLPGQNLCLPWCGCPRTRNNVLLMLGWRIGSLGERFDIDL